MEQKQITAQEVYDLYCKGKAYHDRLGLVQTVTQNENFFIGRQWEGVNAPNLDKPVFNILKRSVNFFVSLLISDDIAIHVKCGDPDLALMAEGAINRVVEETKLKTRFREMLRDAAVDGDGCLYLSCVRKGTTPILQAETVDNINVFFGNTAVAEVQSQPYIILRSLRKADSIKTQFAHLPRVLLDNIRADDSQNDEEAVTVFHYFTKAGGKVYAACCTADTMLQPLFDTGLTRYPVAFMNWDRVKNSYHGEAVVSGLIPNQIFINKTFAMAMKTVKDLSFPKVVYDRTRIRQWSNEAGAAIPVTGNPNEAIASTLGGAGVPSHVMDLVDKTIGYTRDLMGATNAALGDVAPNNTSAIIAVQKASSIPLELQRQSFYQAVEDTALILLDMMAAYYGTATVEYEDSKGMAATGKCDFARLREKDAAVTIDVGASAYFSEIMQVQTLDNLYRNGIITDPLTYLSAIPTGYIRDKERLIRRLQQSKEELI